MHTHPHELSTHEKKITEKSKVENQVLVADLTVFSIFTQRIVPADDIIIESDLYFISRHTLT